jgi:hypothetical protein
LGVESAWTVQDAGFDDPLDFWIRNGRPLADNVMGSSMLDDIEESIYRGNHGGDQVAMKTRHERGIVAGYMLVPYWPCNTRSLSVELFSVFGVHQSPEYVLVAFKIKYGP